MAEIVETKLEEFLKTVDDNDKFVAKALEVLNKNMITECHELERADADAIRKFYGSMPGGAHGFIDRAIKKYEKQHKKGERAADGKPPQLPLQFDPARLEALEMVLAPKVDKPKQHIDLQKTVPQLTLHDLPYTSWPKSLEVDVLASAVEKKRKDTGVRDPFVYIDVEKFLPSWAKAKELDRDGEEEAQPHGKSKEKLQDIMLWSLAFDRYAMAAAITQ